MATALGAVEVKRRGPQRYLQFRIRNSAQTPIEGSNGATLPVLDDGTGQTQDEEGFKTKPGGIRLISIAFSNSVSASPAENNGE
jgi:hypothetical protein